MVSKAFGRDAAARISAGLKVTGSLHAAEAAVEVALVEAQALTALAPAGGGQAAPAKAVNRARLHLARAHQTLADVARRIGLDETAVGPLDKPEDTPLIGGGPRRRKPASRSLA
ncbi:hypothetical protein [Brevundimonas goettingensis]|uniref:Uncharacterized protein n=1 Tax=Brevundimonas goettingensis TaxID=2774190 RepID=A0A975C2J0_9CAUL|nr:hypothetical protein [Brevundimonas goettingensis]QTC91667.1 hypothetical protein IFJ75_01640 [Brevundimonas goettingensis]